MLIRELSSTHTDTHTHTERERESDLVGLVLDDAYRKKGTYSLATYIDD
jgi:hypothetical protein